MKTPYGNFPPGEHIIGNRIITVNGTETGFTDGPVDQPVIEVTLEDKVELLITKQNELEAKIKVLEDKGK